MVTVEELTLITARPHDPASPVGNEQSISIALALRSVELDLPRSRLVFEWIYRLDPRPIDYILQFEGVADPSMDPAVLSERRNKEQSSVERLSATMPRILTMEQLHRWIFTEHDAYSAGMPGFTGSLAVQGLRSSY